MGDAEELEDAGDAGELEDLGDAGDARDEGRLGETKEDLGDDARLGWELGLGLNLSLSLGYWLRAGRRDTVARTGAQ